MKLLKTICSEAFRYIDLDPLRGNCQDYCQTYFVWHLSEKMVYPFF